MLIFLLNSEKNTLFDQTVSGPQSGADLEKYSWGGKRGTGDFEGWHPLAEVYTVCRFN